MDKRKLLFTALMLMIPAVFLEIALQAFYRISNGDFLYERVHLAINAPDPHRVYRTKPNMTFRQRTNEFDATYYTNSMGLRTDADRAEVALDKAPGTYRILFLGPSFAFGWANDYEDTFVSLISEGLKAAGLDIEVMNLGTPGQPISYQLCWLQEEGHKYRPDMVIQTAYGNPTKAATGCYIPANHPTVHNGYLYNSNDPLRVRFLSVVKNSAIVFYGWYAYQFILSDNEQNIGLGTELYEDDPCDTPRWDYAESVDKYRTNVAYIRGILGRDVPVVFLHVPFSYVVRPADLSRWTIANLEDPHVLRRAATNMESLLGQEGIDFVNPLAELISEDEKTRTYYFLDLHFTPAGNRVVAEKAVPLIRDLIASDQRQARAADTAAMN